MATYHVSVPMLAALESIQAGRVRFLSDVPRGTRLALLARRWVDRNPRTRRANLTPRGKMILAAAAAARRADVGLPR